ncbi:13227_t:CDS:2 [Gigaspora margarita]|uniref:13227_t:CDS:1 n=1 Tax=Gigaspora margarita TaxID=4874 RepID=A0ABM8VX36_GIGMA|nr:13227_t:CDS:2 [Gigaspora margarita]
MNTKIATFHIGLVASTKHREQSPTKRLKSSSENQSHKGSAHIDHAINPYYPNLRIPLSNIDPQITVILQVKIKENMYLTFVVG